MDVSGSPGLEGMSPGVVCVPSQWCSQSVLRSVCGVVCESARTGARRASVAPRCALRLGIWPLGGVGSVSASTFASAAVALGVLHHRTSARCRLEQCLPQTFKLVMV